MFNSNYILFSSFGILTQPLYPILELLFFLAAAPTIKPKRLGGEEAREKSLGVEQVYTKDKTEKEQETLERQGKQVKVEVQTGTVPGMSKTEKPEPVSFETSNKLSSIKIGTEEKRKEEETITISTPDVPRVAQEITSSLQEETPKGVSRESTAHLPLTQFGRYKVLELIGRGGMGTVYKGMDPILDRLVALKTIRLDFATSAEEISELKERLVREAKAAGKLSHPNIVTIYDVGEQEGVQYIAMEYLSGYTLESFIKKKKELNYKILAKIIMQVCAALNYAHQKGIVHRDIKPANIMLLEDFAVKVMDFGIARLGTSSLTQSNVALGTPHYISPEQLEGKPADKRSDIFSLGVVIYEFLTGEKPFKGENISSLMYSILHHTPPLPSTLNEKIPLVFDRIISKVMAKNPEERYQETEEIEKTLRQFISSFVVTRSIRV
jgi:serine/threonine protein kinase